MSALIQVKCTNCAVPLRFTPTAEITTLRCPKCQHQMRVKTPAGVPTLAADRSAGTALSTPAAAAQPPSLPTPSGPSIADVDWRVIPATIPQAYVHRPRPSSAANFPAASPRNQVGYPNYSGQPGQRSGLGGANVALICGLLFGGGVLLFAGLIALAVFIGSRPQPKVTIALAGYAVDAPGVLVGIKTVDNATSNGIHHRRTNSEFALSTQPVAPPGGSFELNSLIAEMQKRNTITDVPTPVTRAGLNGVRATLRQPNGLTATAELYKMDEQTLLLLTYTSGISKADVDLGKAIQTPQATRTLDDPEAFFSSFRKQ